MQEIYISGEAEIRDWIPVLLNMLGAKRGIALEGDLGAGKTTLIKHICRSLGVQDEVVSPTFSIINEYRTNQDKVIHHIDLYRLETLEEALDIGIEEYLFGESYVFIEWPGIIHDLIPADFLRVKMETTTDKGRKIVIL